MKKCVECGEKLTRRNRGDEGEDKCVTCLLKADDEFLEKYYAWLDQLNMEKENIESLDDLEPGNVLTRDVSEMGPDDFISHDTMTELKEKLLADLAIKERENK